MLAKTFKGLEEVLAKELVDLGANEVQIERRAVSFVGDKALMYRANLELRTASRILKPIHTFRAKDADEVYEEVKKMDWQQYFAVDATFAIDATVFSESFRHSGYVTYRVKDAIADYFNEKMGKRPSVKVTNPDVMINVHIAGEDVTISLDSSGESLHKRGWREASTEAPINEALAAGLLLLAGWKGQCDLYDPLCGSGTFLIEAAMIAKGIAPGIYRSHFAFEKWPDFDAELFNEIYNDDSREKEFDHHIYGSDASFYCTKVAEKNVQAAGLGKDITVKMCRVQDFKPETTDAFLITNPPYGQRLGANDDICTLYREIGNQLKQQFAGSTAWIISSNEDAMKCVGLKPSRRIPILNGDLECTFNQYELFAGDHKEYKTALAEGRVEKKEESEYQHHKYQSHRRADSGDKPYRRKFDREGADRKPFRRDGEERPFRRREEGDGEGRPFRKFDHEGAERKPFRRDGEERPFRRREEGDGEGRPFRKFDHEGAERKPFRRDGEERPFRRREEAEGEGRSFGRRDGEGRSFGRRDGEGRSFGRRDGESRSFGRRDGEGRPFRPGNNLNKGGRRPYGKDSDR